MKHLVWIALIFVYVFQPPLINKLYYLIAEMAILFLFIVFRFRDWCQAISQFKVELGFVLFIAVISCARDIVTGEMVYADRIVAWAIQAFLFPPLLFSAFAFVSKKDAQAGVADQRIPFYVQISAYIAVSFTLLLFLFPELDELYRRFQVDDIFEIYSGFELRYRAYGIAENLNFTYGYLMGLFAGYSFLMARENKAYLFLTALFLIGVGLNARIGFLVFLVLVLYDVIYRKQVNTFVFMSLIMLSVAFLVIGYLGFDLDNFSWALGFFGELYGFLFDADVGGANNTIVTLLTEHMVFPGSGIEWIFGSGKSIYLDSNHSSDIGYILQLNYAGLPLFLSVLAFFLVCSCRALFILKFKHWYTLPFVVSLFFLNFKGFLLAATPGGRLLFALYMYFIFENIVRNHDLRNCTNKPAQTLRGGM